MTHFCLNSVIACPHCNHLALRRSITSFSTGDLTRWSDGYASCWFAQPSFTQCTLCRGVFWIDEAACIGDILPESLPIEKKRSKIFSWLRGRDEPQDSCLDFMPEPWKNARAVAPPSIEAIAIGVEALVDATKAQEQRMRRLLWWKMNDQYRNPNSDIPSVSETIRDKHEESNMLRLLKLSDQDGRPTIETVEILREMGRFDAARIALEKIDPNTRGFNIIALNIAEKNCRVCAIEEPWWNGQELHNQTTAHHNVGQHIPQGTYKIASDSRSNTESVGSQLIDGANEKRVIGPCNPNARWRFAKTNEDYFRSKLLNKIHHFLSKYAE
jgi:hypothetical protein